MFADYVTRKAFRPCDESVTDNMFVNSLLVVLSVSGFGLFHWLLLVACGWANASDAVEVLCVSFLLPTARCDLLLSSSDMGLLTASIFLGESFKSFNKPLKLCLTVWLIV